MVGPLEPQELKQLIELNAEQTTLGGGKEYNRGIGWDEAIPISRLSEPLIKGCSGEGSMIETSWAYRV
jgi:hypothetical protein